MKKKLMVIAVALMCMLPITQVHAKDTEKKTFTVGMECNYAPFNWSQVDPSDSAVQLQDGGD